MRAIELVSASGELVIRRAGDADFDGAVVALGALGAVVSLTLAVEPTYIVAQHVLTDLPVVVALSDPNGVFANAYTRALFE